MKLEIGTEGVPTKIALVTPAKNMRDDGYQDKADDDRVDDQMQGYTGVLRLVSGNSNTQAFRQNIFSS